MHLWMHKTWFFSFIIFEKMHIWMHEIWFSFEECKLKSWLFIILKENAYLHEFDLECKYIFFKERFSLIPIQRVCTNDRCLFKSMYKRCFLWFFSFMYKYFKNMYKLQSKKNVS